MTRVLIYGSSGKMGREISALIKKDKSIKIVYQVDSANSKGPRSLAEISGKGLDVAIDFSVSAAHGEILSWCVKNKVALLSGTTGLSQKLKVSHKRLAKKIPILWASNMSLGIIVLKQMLKSFGALKGFQFEIQETHHTQKKDRPSGTAVTLKEELAREVGNKNILGIHSYRIGKVFGDHKIIARGESEAITLEHKALNRRVFAEGAVKAAKWLARKGPGLYKIENVLGIEKK